MNRQLNHNEYIHELKKFPIYLILDNINDIVNIGSIFRISDALGVSKIYLCNTNIDLNEKKLKEYLEVLMNMWNMKYIVI